VSLDLVGHRISSIDGTRSAPLKEIPHHARKILESGGLVPHLKGRLEAQQDK